MLPGPLESDKKLAKAAPIFLSMLKSETREETADAVIKAATVALGAHITTQFNCFTAKKKNAHAVIKAATGDGSVGYSIFFAIYSPC